MTFNDFSLISMIFKRKLEEEHENKRQEETEKKLKEEPETQPEALESEAETEKKPEEEQDTQHEVSFEDAIHNLYFEAFQSIQASF